MMVSVTYSFVLKRKEHHLDEEDMCAITDQSIQ